MNILQDRCTCRIITLAEDAVSLRSQKLLASQRRYCESRRNDTASEAILQILRLLGSDDV